MKLLGSYILIILLIVTSVFISADSQAGNDSKVIEDSDLAQYYSKVTSVGIGFNLYSNL